MTETVRLACGIWRTILVYLLVCSAGANPFRARSNHGPLARERISINRDWKFRRFASSPDGLSYDTNLKPWLLPSANDFIVTGSQHERPNGTDPGKDVNYVQASFNDQSWEGVHLPHDWAITGPFFAPGVSGGMGRLPSNGVGWYRRKFTLTADDLGKSIFLDIDGAMSHAAVWLNGKLVGGWPFGYSSFRLDVTPYVEIGETNILATRLENALDSSRWYPGAGIYRNIWLVKVNPVHVGHYGTHVTTTSISEDSATMQLIVDVENMGNQSQGVNAITEVRLLDSAAVVVRLDQTTDEVAPGTKQSVNGSFTIPKPLLWGPPPTQKPNLYLAVTTLYSGDGLIIDTYETRFGIRSVTLESERGVLVNGEQVYIKGTCNHHDLGSLGAAFNYRAAERQLQLLQEMGTNALRTSHNPAAPELLDLADSLGFLVMDEAFDVWSRPKLPNDYHLLFSDWHEPDLRSLIRRDFNHPSVIAWSIGNEIPEQRQDLGTKIGRELHEIVGSEDPTRPSTTGLNNGRPGDGLPDVLDVIGLNYQGEGYGNSWTSTFPAFHERYPDKMIWSSESASALSTRGTYLFPVVVNISSVVANGTGGADNNTLQVSAYELYGPSWGSSPDKVFVMQDRHRYVAGEFVWTGFDYLGEPTPFDYSARSSYFGILDLAGFKKDRFFLYQSRWRPNLPVAHILPHWSWPNDRIGQVTPVHVFSAADEAELFVNEQSIGRLTKQAETHRFRWDNVTYSPGSLRVVTYKDGSLWAEDTKKTVGPASALKITADREILTADGYDLSFITATVVDDLGDTVPQASNNITFSITGPGEIVATDNGNPTDLTVFQSLTRKAFSGLTLAIVRTMEEETGEITVSADADELGAVEVTLRSVSNA